VCAAAGFRVKVFDAAVERAIAGVDFAGGMLRRAAERGQLSADAAVARLEVCAQLEQFRDAGLVIEAAAEDMEIKQQLFPPDRGLGGRRRHPRDQHLLAGRHAARFSMPPAAARGGHALLQPGTADEAGGDHPGLLTEDSWSSAWPHASSASGTHRCWPQTRRLSASTTAGRAFYTEGVRIVGEGWAAVQDVDRVAKEALGFRIGPFELFDLTGLDVSYRVLTQIYHQYFEEPRFRPTRCLPGSLPRALYGRKNGRGFYAVRRGSRHRTARGGVSKAERSAPVWIADRGEDGGA